MDILLSLKLVSFSWQTRQHDIRNREGDELQNDWRTKPSDRFILKWIKLNLSARITPRLLPWTWLHPWMITVCSSALGMLAGLIFALGWGWIAGFVAAASQILDGVDGQFARLTDRQSEQGAFLDSVLDRYADGAMMIGLTIYLVRLPFPLSAWSLVAMGALAFIGSNLISYSSARAESLGLDMGQPTLASKGTRSGVMIVCALATLIWPRMPIIALVYLAAHPNVVVISRLIRSQKAPRTI